jgi:Domain of unknown function (DUF4249)
MKKHLFILLITSGLAAQTCIGPANLENIRYEEQLVVHSYISPQDTLVQVAVSKNFPAQEANARQRPVAGLQNLVVTLSEGSQRAVLTYIEPTSRDLANNWRRYGIPARQFPVRAGQTYRLEVSSPEGQRVNATCTVPARAVNPSDINLALGTGLFASERYVKVNVTWPGRAGEGNHYNLFMQSSVQLADPRANPRNIGQNYGPFLLNDAHVSGSQVAIPASQLIGGTNRPFNDARSTLTIYLASVDINYFEYNLSIGKQLGEQTNNQLPEPVSIKSNINGGLGVFGALNLTTVRRSIQP